MENKNIKRWTHFITAIVIISMGLFLYYGLENNLFSDMDSLKQFIAEGGIWGPLIFVLIQIIQVVIPIIPGGVSCAAGVVLFGPWAGLLYNYVGIVIGSFINFYLARKYGTTLVKSFVSESTYDKYSNWLDKGKKFDKFFALAIFFPVAPDDFLCMLAGLTKMSLKRFSAIILLGKPASIAMYSLTLIYAGSWLEKFISLG
ncbi:MAG: TVP38/TMEM64 family protein [Beduini sp.]|uniref:TVP38/TMEM64 family protein n=1 Tax=Beduini sp. TaxID=1922300 RepID=UPI0011CA0DC2